MEITIHQLYDAFIRAVEHYQNVDYDPKPTELNIAFPVIGKDYVPDRKLKFELQDRMVVLKTKVTIIHKFSKLEIYGEREITELGNGKFYKKNREKIDI